MNLMVCYAQCSENTLTVNQLMRRQRAFLSGSSAFYSKSHSAGWIAAAIGTSPVAVDIESIGHFYPLSDLERKLRFYTSDKIAEKILSAEDPPYQAAKLWTRKECVFKLCNKRNGIEPERIYNESDFISVGSHHIFTIRVTAQILLSYMCSADCEAKTVRRIYGDNQHEAF